MLNARLVAVIFFIGNSDDVSMFVPALENN